MKAFFNSRIFISLFLLTYFLLHVVLLFAQDTKKQREEGNVHIRIEKYENGKKKVYEKTYQAGKEPKVFNFEDSDSLFNFKTFGKHASDSTFFHYPAGKFYFQDTDSALGMNKLFFYQDSDSLLAAFNHHFKFEGLDSLLHHYLGDNQLMLQDLNKEMKTLRLDSLINRQENFMKDFNFHWDDNGKFNLNNDQLNLMLDKDLYDMEEIETDSGKKMMKITPKKEEEVEKKKTSKKLRKGMQLLPSSLTLYVNSNRRVITIQLDLPATDAVTVKITDSQGKEVFKDTLKKVTENHSMQIDLGKERRGYFIVELTQNNQTVSKKVFVE